MNNPESYRQEHIEIPSLPDDCTHKNKYLSYHPKCNALAEMCQQKCHRPGHKNEQEHKQIQIKQLVTRVKLNKDKKHEQIRKFVVKLDDCYEQVKQQIRKRYEKAKDNIKSLYFQQNQIRISNFVQNEKTEKLACSHIYYLQNMDGKKQQNSKKDEQANKIIIQFAELAGSSTKNKIFDDLVSQIRLQFRGRLQEIEKSRNNDKNNIKNKIITNNIIESAQLPNQKQTQKGLQQKKQIKKMIVQQKAASMNNTNNVNSIQVKETKLMPVTAQTSIKDNTKTIINNINSLSEKQRYKNAAANQMQKNRVTEAKRGITQAQFNFMNRPRNQKINIKEKISILDQKNQGKIKFCSNQPQKLSSSNTGNMPPGSGFLQTINKIQSTRNQNLVGLDKKPQQKVEKQVVAKPSYIFHNKNAKIANEIPPHDPTKSNQQKQAPKIEPHKEQQNQKTITKNPANTLPNAGNVARTVTQNATQRNTTQIKRQESQQFGLYDEQPSRLQFEQRHDIQFVPCVSNTQHDQIYTKQFKKSQ